MNKNCIILEIRKQFKLDPDATPPGSLCVKTEVGTDVWPELTDYDGPCVLYTPEEAAAEVERLSRYYYPGSRYQVVVVSDITP